MKKLFGGINLTWTKVIVMAVVIAIYTAASLLIPITRHTSFSDLGATFEVWIFFGIFIIMNSKTAKESALKCFVFFLISQPLIFLIQDIIDGSRLFSEYYTPWFMWTILCLPMGYIGHYMKKNKWWGLLILTPILALLGYQYVYYLPQAIYAFPKHVLTVIFCIVTLIIYPIYIFKDKIRIIGLIISIIILIVATFFGLKSSDGYSTDVLISGGKYTFDNNCTITVTGNNIGELSFKYIDTIDDYSIHGDFKKTGETSFILECPEFKKTFNLVVKQNTYEINEVEYVKYMETAIFIVFCLCLILILASALSYLDLRIHLKNDKKIDREYMEKKVKLFMILTIITVVLGLITLILKIIEMFK